MPATSVYRYYDGDGVLLYVGITTRGIQRQHEHNARAEWWPLVARQDVEHHPSRDAALGRERELIQRHRPPFNTQHVPNPAAARAAYLIDRRRHVEPCACGPNCQQFTEGWAAGLQQGLKMYPNLYADEIAELIARGCDDAETAAAAWRFVDAGMLLAHRLGATAGSAALIREILPAIDLIEQHCAQLVVQDNLEPDGEPAA